MQTCATCFDEFVLITKRVLDLFDFEIFSRGVIESNSEFNIECFPDESMEIQKLIRDKGAEK